MNPLAVFEPLRREIAERQMALFGMALAWSPAHVLVNQQAAFWGGFVEDGAAPAARRPKRKPAKRAKPAKSRG